MTNFSIWVFILLGVAGCAQVKAGGNDYLKADQWRQGTMKDAYESVRDDYLKSGIGDKKAQQEAELAASEHLKASLYKDQFDFLKPFTDKDAGMPETAPFYFIHFPSRDISDANRDVSFLVIVRRGACQIVFADIFKKPQGDLFYRYKEILKTIK
ncbi:MAG: hypothetical protein HQL26_10180 [Candidatus Omnitrophica bacterium]|nr:hypothetical protein [Candidatus Omnitrophota bacterium]